MSKRALRDAYGNTLASLAAQNKDIVALDADVSGSTRSAEMLKTAPERHFNVGIAEENLYGIAAGLACNGKIPFASTFAMFASGRAFEIIHNSICYPDLNVKICVTHAGITVGEDGATHQALEDISLMRSIPNMTVIQPCDYRETEEAVRFISEYSGPVYLRMGRSKVEDVNDDYYHFEFGKGVILHDGKSPITMFATGIMVQESLKALKTLNDNGVDPTIINIHTIKPIDEQLIIRQALKSELLVTLEEHSVIGGLGSAVAEITSRRAPVRQLFIGTEDVFGESGTPEQLMGKYGLSASRIAEKIIQNIKK